MLRIRKHKKAKGICCFDWAVEGGFNRGLERIIAGIRQTAMNGGFAPYISEMLDIC